MVPIRKPGVERRLTRDEFVSQCLREVRKCARRPRMPLHGTSQGVDCYIVNSVAYSPFRVKEALRDVSRVELKQSQFENWLAILTVEWLLSNHVPIETVQNYLKDQQVWPCIEVFRTVRELKASIAGRYEGPRTTYNIASEGPKHFCWIHCEIESPPPARPKHRRKKAGVQR